MSGSKGDVWDLISYSRFEHIGASSIKGAVSKGDLDIFVGVEAERFQETISKLEDLGFKEKADTMQTNEIWMMITDAFTITM